MAGLGWDGVERAWASHSPSLLVHQITAVFRKNLDFSGR